MLSEFEFSVEQLVDGALEPAAREDAWRSVFRHYDPRLRDYFRGRVGSESDLDELMSEVWRRVLLGISKLRSHRAAWTWMTTIGVHVLRSSGRSQRRLDRRIAAFEREAAPAPSSIEFLSRIEAELPEDDRVSTALARIASLPPSDQEFIRLVAEEVSHVEIAKRLNLPSAAACRQRLRRLRVAIQADLAR